MSFIKFRNTPDVVDGRRGKLSFSRADVDGMPWRGEAPPLREEEIAALAEVVHETFVREFNLSDPAQLAAWQEVYNRIINGLYRCTCVIRERVPQPDGTRPMVIYVEYTEPAMEVPPEKVQQLFPVAGAQ